MQELIEKLMEHKKYDDYMEYEYELLQMGLVLAEKEKEFISKKNEYDRKATEHYVLNRNKFSSDVKANKIFKYDNKEDALEIAKLEAEVEYTKTIYKTYTRYGNTLSNSFIQDNVNSKRFN
jgi:hypothetical protein